MPTAPKILLVDSDATFRRMVRDMIRRHYPDVTISEAHNREDALRQVRRQRPGLILTEIDMDGRRSLDLPQKMHAVHPKCVIAVMTSYDLPEYQEEALQGGARHFISKSVPSGPAILTIVGAALTARSKPYP